MGLSEDLQKLANARGWTDLIDSNLNGNRSGTYDFWKSLKKANRDYLDIDVNADGTFVEFMKYNYGVQLHLDDTGNIKAQYEIINEQQHLMFMLKYS